MSMKPHILILSVVLVALTGCADLVVKNLEVDWESGNRIATAEIANIGSKDAGSFMVYFNGDEDPESQNHRPQVRHNVPGLDGGDSVVLTADFAPLAHPDNNSLANIYQITVLVDPKGMVKESNENNNSRSVAVRTGSGEACVDFGPPPATGTQYGNPAGHSPGDVVLVDPGGIKMSVQNFRWVSGGGTFNSGRIETPPVSFGSGQTLRSNNLNFAFDFTNTGFTVSKVVFDYLDLGGFENLSVNGQPVPVFAGELTAAPSPVAGVNVAVTAVPVTGGKKGTVTLTGVIQRMWVGGQELWVDNVCARH